MQAIRIHQYGGPLQIDKIDKPAPGRGQVLIQMEATSLNPVDQGRASGALKQIMPLDFPWIPGGDLSGTVESVGEGVTGCKAGDAVFGYSAPGGAYAEFIAADASSIALRPPSLTAEQAAAVAMVGQTATQSLGLAKVGEGTKVLIHGGAGGVGSLAVQIAHRAGAHVTTTARPEQKEALLGLGADTVIDFTSEEFESYGPFDAVIDLIGGDTLLRSYAVVKSGGILVTANQPPDPKLLETHGIQGFFVQTEVTSANLKAFAERVERGEIVPLIERTETLWNPEALWARRPAGTGVGKVVFAIQAS